MATSCSIAKEKQLEKVMSSELANGNLTAGNQLIAGYASNKPENFQIDGVLELGEPPDSCQNNSALGEPPDHAVVSNSPNENIKNVNKHSSSEAKKNSKKKIVKESDETGKDVGRLKNKEDKGIDQVLKSLNSLPTTEDKLSVLSKRYSELLESHKHQQNKQKQYERLQTMLQREKEQVQNENSKAILAKSKLTSLCRELQRQNKLIKDESMQRVREQEEKRKEVSSKFQTTLNDITAQMQENYQSNAKLKDENIELSQKLKGLVDQYEIREQHVDKIIKHKELETQLAEARLAQVNLQLAEEKEKHLKDKEKLLIEATHYQKKCDQLESSEANLRTQLSLYIEKYDDFQKTLNKSNDVFASFKGEMEKMTKKIKKLEKETSMWRTRWEGCNRSLLEMVDEKANREKEATTLQTKLIRLEKLCRALQSERNALTNKFKNEVGSREMGSMVHPKKEFEMGISPERESSVERADLSMKLAKNLNAALQGNSNSPPCLAENNLGKMILSSELTQAASEVEKLKAVVKATKEMLAATSNNVEFTTDVNKNDEKVSIQTPVCHSVCQHNERENLLSNLTHSANAEKDCVGTFWNHQENVAGNGQAVLHNPLHQIPKGCDKLLSEIKDVQKSLQTISCPFDPQEVKKSSSAQIILNQSGKEEVMAQIMPEKPIESSSNNKNKLDEIVVANKEGKLNEIVLTTSPNKEAFSDSLSLAENINSLIVPQDYCEKNNQVSINDVKPSEIVSVDNLSFSTKPLIDSSLDKAGSVLLPLVENITSVVNQKCHEETSLVSGAEMKLSSVDSNDNLSQKASPMPLSENLTVQRVLEQLEPSLQDAIFHSETVVDLDVQAPDSGIAESPNTPSFEPLSTSTKLYMAIGPNKE